ncbi:MAG TPA: carboxypeptidase regulatory-like domain-containing protein, partial [Glycomyces sp.]|nr:carboxypeptidase regulatory-like domain-containing protein [Glycomyces sp.]
MTVAAEPSGTQTNVLRSPRGRGGGLRACLAGLAAAGGMLLGILAFPQAALAQGDFNAWVSQGHDPQLDIGGATATVTVDVLATFPPGHGPKDAEIKGSLSGLDGMAFVGVGGVCEASGDSSVKCSRMTSGETRQVQFIVTTQAEADLPQGESRTGQLNIEFPGGTTQTSVTVRGTASAGISEISGTVTSNAQPVPDAKLELTDGEGEDHETTTDGDGNYTFTGSGSDPIAPGEMTLVITAEGFQDKEDTFEVSEGSGSYKRNVTLAAEEVAEPTSAAPTPEASPTPAAASEDPPEGNGISGTLIFLIVIGALLVVGGIIGIIFLLRGSKDGDKDDGESFAPDGPPDHQPTAAQVGTPGVYQAGPAPGSDAPTMIHPGGLVDSGAAAPTQFGPAYGGGSDSTQVMPQGGFGAAPGAPGMPGGQVGPDGTTILPVVKQPGGPSASDATQIMPQANLGAKPPASAPPSPYADPAATRPHPGPSASPSPYS